MRSPKDIGKHLLKNGGKIGRQFQKKPQMVVPNCAVIMPQRYKKEEEERMAEQYYKELEEKKNRISKKTWKPGGKTVVHRPQSAVDRNLMKKQQDAQREIQMRLSMERVPS